MGITKGKRPLGRTSRRWEKYIKMDLQGVECRSMDWIDPAEDSDRCWAFVKVVMNLRVP